MLDFTLLTTNWLKEFGPALVINEFLASSSRAGGLSDPQGDFDDWIEIHNFGRTPIDLAGMYLTDDLDRPTAWRFPFDRPADTTIDPGGYLIVWADEDVADIPGLHADLQLSSDGEEIGLFDKDATTLVDSVDFGDQVSNVSYGRFPDGSNEWRFFAAPSPIAPNTDAYLGPVADTKFSHDRGFYEGPFSLTIACSTPGVHIYYTMDGSAPIENEQPSATGKPYTGPIPISSNACVRAAALKTGWMPSNTDTHTYIFDADEVIRSMPVVSLVGDEDKTFYGPDGIMSHFTERGIAFERAVSLEILDPRTGTNLQEDCGIRIHGSGDTRPQYTIGDDWSTCWVNWWPRTNYNKIGFNLWFRSTYGNNRLEHPFFPFSDVDRFKSIVLRQGKNDGCAPFVKDEWVRRLFQEMGRVQVTGTFASLYLNGQYKSYYNPTARGDEEFYQEWYGTDSAFDVITQSGVRNGDSVAWNSLLSYVDSHDMADPAHYEHVAGKLDIPTFIDFLILEIHVGNFDWPNNNWDVHRERSDDGIFRFSVWDAEGVEQWYFGANCENCADTAFDKFPSYDPQGLNGGPWPICRLYRGLTANPEFRQLFADHVHRHYRNGGVLTEAHLLQRWNEVFAEISAALPYTGRGVVTFIPDVFIPARTPYVLAAFHDNHLIDLSIDYPVFNVNGSPQHGGRITADDTITIAQLPDSGAIYYTTDGADPRSPVTAPLTKEPLILNSNTKKVLVPAGDIGASWRGGSEPYDDSGWTGGTGGVGYERGSGYEHLIGIDVNAAMSSNATCYVRIPFSIDGDQPPYSRLELRIRYDDAFVAYLNGVEVHREGFTGAPQWNSRTSSSHEASAAWSSCDITDHIEDLHPGENILALHGINASTGSSDFLISAELYASAGPPDPVISSSAIAYAGGFHLPRSAHLKARILTETGQWSVLNEAVYGVGPVAQSLRISELMYHPEDPNEEFIELVNVGDEPMNLNLVRFTKGVDLAFGNIVLGPRERIVAVRDRTAFMNRYPDFSGPIAGPYEGRLDDAGEKIRLRDATDAVIQEFVYKDGWYEITDGDGFSLTVRDSYAADPDAWSAKDAWRPSAALGGSPGADDYGQLPNPGAVIINEVLAHSHAADPDWIELHNTTDEPIHIGGWFLSDSDRGDPNVRKYEIPVGTSIPAGGYVVFYQDLHFGNPSAEGVHKPFALSEGGDSVYLRGATEGMLGGYGESETFGPSASNVAFGRHIKSQLDGGVNFVAMSANTPGAENAYPQVGPIVITEIMYHPGGDNTGGEFIELHNITDAGVTLEDAVETESSPGVIVTDVVPWRFSDGVEFVFPPNTTIPPHGHLIIAQDPTAFPQHYGPMPADVEVLGPFQNSTALSNGGERLQIVRPGDQEYGRERYWIRTERVTYDDEDPWPKGPDGSGLSLQRGTPDSMGANYGNDAANWKAAPPNPGR